MHRAQANRRRFFEKMGPHSLAVFFAKPKSPSRFPFCQDPNFYHLTSCEEPGAILMLHKTERERTILLCAPYDAEAARWGETHLGPDRVKKMFLVDTCPLSEALGLLRQLAEQVRTIYLELNTPGATMVLTALQQATTTVEKKGGSLHVTLQESRPMMAELRLIKSEAELECLRRAAQITCVAHRYAMQAASQARNEAELEALLHYVFNVLGAKIPAYGSIVAGGQQGQILHYSLNNAPLLPEEMVLIDAGCQYQGYAADVTRTFPISGRFSPPQERLYTLLLSAQQAAFTQVKPGGSFAQAEAEMLKVLVPGLIDLGILHGEPHDLISTQAYKPYTVHSLGHWLGLEVHDVGSYGLNKTRPFEAGMVLTIEPGLYLDGPSVPALYRGLAIRIEDDLVVTPSGHEELTAGAPKTIEAITQRLAQPSPFPMLAEEGCT